ncbi:protein unc-119 homolog B isoform X2 [Ischnura elegans]|uniref:protein unc-119 homolog B isoform X2 n=1 Tax=Ischnura elegans TaxID=197161 RepID=UPI001ED88314|nr:protein unc-119 homolog B isoform X2 [Ischnura elegans]
MSLVSNIAHKKNSNVVTNVGVRQAKSRKDCTFDSSEVVTEEALILKEIVTPEDVLRLPRVTENYLCSPEANVYDIDFTRFKIRDLDTGTVLFEIAKPPPVAVGDSEADVTDENGEKHNGDNDQPPGGGASTDYQEDNSDPNAGRFVRYQFTPQFLKLKTVGATVEFTVGSRAVNKFRMIERHYFRDRLLKSFDFEFGFCIPNSRNTCEHIYEFPSLGADLVSEMINHPFETRSDSFYFVDDRLIMHNKADYAYDGGLPSQH